MAKKDYESRTEAMLMPIVEAKGFELVDVEWVKEGANWYLRAYIDKPGGIAVDDWRQKRPRRNESLQARLLILCAHFFLSKPQAKLAVWVL